MLMKLFNPIIDRIVDRVTATVVRELTAQLPAIVESATRGVTDEVLDRLLGDSDQGLVSQVAQATDNIVERILNSLPWPLGKR